MYSLDIARHTTSEDNGSKEKTIYDLLRQLQTSNSTAADFIDKWRDITFRVENLSQTYLNISAAAGKGKSHVACHIVQERLLKGLPALLIAGANFKEAINIQTALLDMLDVPRNYNWKSFIQALATSAKAHNTRLLIVIDGLNETTQGGVFSSIWKQYLPGLNAEIKEETN